MIRLISIFNLLFLFLFGNSPGSLSVGPFLQEQRIIFNSDNGLPSNDVRDIVSTNDGTVFVSTSKGLIAYSNKQWVNIDGLENTDIWLLASNGNEVAILGGDEKNNMLSNSKIYIIKNGRLDKTIIIPSRYKIPLQNNDLSFYNNIMLGTSNDIILFERRYGNTFKQSSKPPFSPNTRPVELKIPAKNIRQITVSGSGVSYVATDSALLKLRSPKEGWRQVLP